MSWEGLTASRPPAKAEAGYGRLRLQEAWDELGSGDQKSKIGQSQGDDVFGTGLGDPNRTLIPFFYFLSKF